VDCSPQRLRHLLWCPAPMLHQRCPLGHGMPQRSSRARLPSMPACKYDLGPLLFEDGIWHFILFEGCSMQVSSRTYGSGRQSNDEHGMLKIVAILARYEKIEGHLRGSLSNRVLARRGLKSATSSVSPSTGSANSVVVASDCSL